MLFDAVVKFPVRFFVCLFGFGFFCLFFGFLGFVGLLLLLFLGFVFCFGFVGAF